MNDIDELDPELSADLEAIRERLAQGPSNNPGLDRDVAALRTRVIYASAVSQAQATKRLVWATWVLAASTLALVFATIVLAVIAASAS